MTDSTQAAAQLLECVAATKTKVENWHRETGAAYNIFRIAGIGHKEVPMCRVLANLLDPKGCHYRGSAYLQIFMDTVAKPFVKNTEKLDLLKAKVTTEYTTDEGRFIDIVIDDGNVFIPIEAKIYAGEQEKQLADYAAFSRKMNSGADFIPVLFLTPSGYKSEETPDDEYVPISFATHIIQWLEKCLSLEETDKALPIREVLKQFIAIIKSFCGNMEDEEMEINALITESKDSYATAVSVFNAVNASNNRFIAESLELFREGGKIFELVKSKQPGVQWHVEQGWHYLYFLIGNGCDLNINYDMRYIVVNHIEPENPISAETAAKIDKIMSRITGKRNEGGTIWASHDARYPGLKDIEDDIIYRYELHKIYSKDPQSVADKIASWVTELKSI